MLKIFKDIFKYLFNGFFFRQVLKHKKKAAFTLSILFGQAIIMSIFPLPLKFLFDEILKKNTAPTLPNWTPEFLVNSEVSTLLILCTSIWVFLFLINNLLDYLELVYVTKFGNSIIESGRKEITSLVLTRDQRFLNLNPKADIVGRMSQDTLAMQFLVDTAIPLIARGVPSVFLILGVFAALDKWYLLIGVLKFSILIYAMIFFAKKIIAARKKVRTETTRFEQNSLQFLSSVQTVKSQGLEIEVKKKSARHARAVSNETIKAVQGEGLMNFTFAGSKAIFRYAVYIGGGLAVIAGYETVGTIVILAEYINSVHHALKDFRKFSYKSAKSFASIDRIEDFIKRANEMPEPPSGALASRSGKIEVQFSDMSFWYHKDTPILKNCSTTFSAGTLNAFVGVSGAGKSTLLALFNRLLVPSEGKVLVCGKELSQYNTKFLRSMVTYVPQESHIIRGTLRANLDFAAIEKVTDDELWDILKKVGAEDFVRKLPNKLDTVIGEAGFTLSCGQARKIGLARAFVPPPRAIYVFDEPTAGLDPDSAKIFMKSLIDLRNSGAIVFFSTHITTEMAMADSVYEIKDASITKYQARQPLSGFDRTREMTV